jgi:GDP-L-fucose synthase
MDINSKIYIAGHNGMVGNSIMKILISKGFKNLILYTKNQLDLTDYNKVSNFFNEEKPEYVFMCAAKVGGILANKEYSANFIYDNIQIQNNIIHNSYLHNVKKLLFLGSSCIYPKNSEQPIKEEYLLSSQLEETNKPYAIAKISGIIMCQSYNKQYKTNFISAMPTNLYGYNDNFDLNTSHVLPALIRKFHDAKKENKEFVEIWGTGNPLREFLFIDDLAEACLLLMEKWDSSEIINIGTGKDISIKDLAYLIKDIIKYEGDIIFNEKYPDGTYKKLLDISKIQNLGWNPKTTLKEGIKKTYDYYVNKYTSI